MNSVNLDKYSDPFFLGETKEELRRIRQDFHVHPEIGLVTREPHASLLTY